VLDISFNKTEEESFGEAWYTVSRAYWTLANRSSWMDPVYIIRICGQMISPADSKRHPYLKTRTRFVWRVDDKAYILDPVAQLFHVNFLH
jgi:hypothetical protein